MVLEKTRQLIFQNQGKIKYVLFISIILTGINCFSKYDYNIVLYLYLYFLWDNNIENRNIENSEKVNSFLFLVFSLIIDFIWLFIWPKKWISFNDYDKNIHSIIKFLSWILIFIKVLITFSIGIFNLSDIKKTLPNQIQERLSGNFKKQEDEN